MKTLTKSALFLLWLLIPMSIFAQSSVSGTVTDASTGQPIPGVNVIVKNTTNGTTSDFDGNYSISNVKKGNIITFSYVGFATQEIEYTGQAKINASLDEDAAELEQVVLIGYGAARKKDLTGSVSTITTDDFNKGNIVTPENLLSGRIAGVTVNTAGGPGAGSQIRIRGGGSLNASNDPLIVIDGLPLSNNNVAGSRSILATIDPNNIKSFTVLKDASATAIYGNRASAGVIIIETIKGSKSFKVDYNFQSGYYTVPNKIDVFDADEYRQIVAERAPGLVSRLGNANTDWQDEIYSSAISTENNVSVRGALFNKTLPIRFSAGHLDQPGVRRTSRFQRTSTSLAVNPTFLDGRLKVNLNANASFEKNRFADGVERSALRFDPTQPVYDPNSPLGDGFFEYFNTNNGIIQDALPTNNPVAALLQRRNVSDVDRYYGNFKVDYSPAFLPELTATVNVGFDESKGSGSNELSRNSIAGATINAQGGLLDGSRTEYSSYRRNTLFDSYLNYKKEFGNLKVDATGGYSYQEFKVSNFNTGELRGDDAVEADTFTAPNVVLAAFFGRANFTLNDKYLLTLSLRRDGTSRFNEDNRWGNFPAAAFAWNITDENFLKDSKTLSNLKLRVGYGVTGQQAIGVELPYIERYRRGSINSQYIFGDNTLSVVIPSFRNVNTRWEEATTYNAGIDYGFANDRISGSVDVFRKETNDLFVFATVPDGANFSNRGDQNVGTLVTEGIEFAINADIIKNEDFSWNVNYNATLIDQEIEELVNGEDIPVGGIAGGTGGTVQLHSEGFAPNSFYVFRQLYNANGQPIEGAYADLNGDNVINNEDRYIYRNQDADVTMGFQSNFSYKNFDFSFNLRASLGNYVYNNVNSSLAQYDLLQDNSALGNIPVSVLDTNFNTTGDVILSDIYVEDASFLKMDNLTFGYTFNKFLGESSTFRLWTGVQNVFIITDYSGLDPEVNGIDNTIFPRSRTFLLGANVKF